MSHICTTESFIIQELEPIKGKCPICCQITTQRITWVSILCEHCRSEFGPDYTMAYIVRMRRKYCNLNRKEWSKLTGLSKDTITSYEWKIPSKHYFILTERLVNQLKPTIDELERGN